MNFLRWMCALTATLTLACSQAEAGAPRWEMGTPIVSYWAGPAMTDKTAQQMAEGGWKRVCPSCKGIGMAEATLCGHCWAKLVPTTTEATPA